MDKRPKLWYIGWSAYGKLTEKLAKKVRASKRKYDLVVGIARGGVPVALVIADRLKIRIDIINVKSYNGIAKRSAPKILSTLTNNVRGKRILLVDDLVEEGDTMETVIKHLLSQKPRTINTAVLFKKPWSKFNPDFYLRTIRKWATFPWDIEETKKLSKSA